MYIEKGCVWGEGATSSRPHKVQVMYTLLGNLKSQRAVQKVHAICRIIKTWILIDTHTHTHTWASCVPKLRKVCLSVCCRTFGVSLVSSCRTILLNCWPATCLKPEASTQQWVKIPYNTKELLLRKNVYYVEQLSVGMGICNKFVYANCLDFCLIFNKIIIIQIRREKGK